MAIVTRTQSARGSSQEYAAALIALESELVQPRLIGHALTRRHTMHIKITWPEKYHERYRLPSAIEQQPF